MQQHLFPSETYTHRRAALKRALSGGLLLFPGNEESPMNYAANTLPFRQDSNFLYYFGIDAPGLAAIIDLDSGAEMIFGEELTMEDIVWTGPLPTLKDRAAKIGVSSTQPLAALDELISKAKAAGRVIHFLPPYRADNKIKLFRWLGIHPDEQKARASADFIKAVVAQRSIKTEEEIREIEHAVRLTNEVHLAAMRVAAPGKTEAEVVGEMMKVWASDDCMPSFPPIVTINGQTLHNHAHHNKLKSGRLLLVDSGAESLMHYAGDLTRTFPVDKKFTPRQKEVYEVVLSAQVAACEAIRPGTFYRDVHLLAATRITEGLKALGLMKGDTQEAVAAGAHALFFQHGLGHMMGLDVHDMEDLGENYVGYGDGVERSTQFGLAYLRLARKLQPGFVLTVEPGIYFIPELIDMWKADQKLSQFINYEKAEQYKDFGGIRIEEDYLVTATGGRLLGNAIPKTVADIEAYRAAE